jgi:AcrR family transcriptional regulator
MNNSIASSNPTQPDRLTPKGQSTRQNIVNAAMTLIRSQGYAGTNLRAICKEAGIAIGTFYHYFQTKEEVLLAYVDEEYENLLNFYTGLERTSSSEAILSVANHYIDMYVYKGADLVSNIYAMIYFSKVKIGDYHENAFYKILRDAFLRGQESGEYSHNVEPDTFCDMLMGEWFFLTTLWCNEPETFDVRTQVAHQFKALFQLVENPKS